MNHTQIRSRMLALASLRYPLIPLRSLPFVLFVIFVFCLVSTRVQAQDLTLKAAPQSKPVAIIGATIHPVSGPTIEGGYIVFDRGRITQVGPGKLEAVAGMDVIDGKGRHVYPGLIAAFTGLGLNEFAPVRQMRDSSETGSIIPEVRACVSINPDSTLIPVARAGGILTMGVFPSGGVISGQPSAMRTDGWTWEEMAIVPSLGVVVNWPQARPITAWWMNQSKEDQLKEIRRNLDLIDQTFKTARAYAEARDLDHDTPIDLRWEAMRRLFPAKPPAAPLAPTPAAEQSRVFIQAGDADQITQAVAWAADLGLKAVVIGGRDAPLCAEVLKKHDVPVIVTGVDTMPRRDDAEYDDAYTLPARLEALGIPWCLASGEESAHERRLAENAGRASAFGLPRDAAVRAITLSAARVLGIESTLGSLETGKSATLIVTDGDVLEISTHVIRAFIDGRTIDLSTKQTKLADKYRERYRQQKAAAGK